MKETTCHKFSPKIKTEQNSFHWPPCFTLTLVFMNREWGSKQNHSERETYDYKQTKFK